jgi:heptosyltransferase II
VPRCSDRARSPSPPEDGRRNPFMMADLPDIIRTPNHLGDLVMALPALGAAPEADLLIARWLVPIVQMLGHRGRAIPFDRGRRGMIAAVRLLRGRRYGHGVLLPPSLSSALVFRLGGVSRVRGAATNGRTLLLTDPVPRDGLTDRHRTDVYLELVTGGGEAGQAPVLPVPPPVRDRWRALRDGIAAGAGPLAGTGPLAGIFPGSNARSRRWDAARFAALVEALASAGTRVVVFGAAMEAGLTREVAGGRGVDLGGRTDLPVLAAALSECHILVTNDSGPMHLAAAVGTRTLVVSGPADTRETAPRGGDHVYLQRLDLPCVPCVKNECPRRGAGYILPEAERECLRLIEVPEVLSAALRMLRT